MQSRPALPYLVLDVFSNKSYKGNPLAVVFTEGDLAVQNYEDIAREFGYSETSFAYYNTAENILQVRSFSPAGVEVGGAGHNLLGAVAAAIVRELVALEPGQFTLLVKMKDRVIPVYLNQDTGSELISAKMLQKPSVTGNTIPAETLATALGVTTDLFGARGLLPSIVQTEVAHAMVPVSSVELLNSLRPDNKLLTAISTQCGFEGFYCFAFADDSASHVAEARFFNPLIGIDEDAATGTAAGPLAGFLYSNKLIQKNESYKILQGVKLNQPSVIEVTVKDEGILVGGISVVTMEGQLFLE